MCLSRGKLLEIDNTVSSKGYALVSIAASTLLPAGSYGAGMQPIDVRIP